MLKPNETEWRIAARFVNDRTIPIVNLARYLAKLRTEKEQAVRKALNHKRKRHQKSKMLV